MRFLVRTAAWMSALILFAGGTAFAQEPEATEEEYTQVVGTHPQDPWERYNRAVFTFNETVDRYTLKPVARAYRAVMPDIGERAVSNFFSNLSEPRNLINNVLQGKGEAALITTARFLFNTTFGLGGLIDVATSFDLPEQDEDFGQTLGAWGVDSGPFLMLPFLGPSTVRDAGGFAVDVATPSLRDEFESPEKYYLLGLKAVEVRARLLPLESAMTQGDRYWLIRTAYLQQREYQVRDGQVDDPFTDDDELMLDDF